MILCQVASGKVALGLNFLTTEKQRYCWKEHRHPSMVEARPEHLLNIETSKACFTASHGAVTQLSGLFLLREVYISQERPSCHRQWMSPFSLVHNWAIFPTHNVSTTPRTHGVRIYAGCIFSLVQGELEGAA